ncbi:MAG TPA: PaaI family thioesterase [Candidatus Polarisedimenticolaceae bacterium]|nr:PaaI family thioesterase [Candidatus Polarisedimenticolaceae bacterium]
MTNDRILNRKLLPANTCFGCGHENPHGLHIEVLHDPADAAVLRGRFVPHAGMTGFPGVVHGGVIFSALDCLATWVVSLLRDEPDALWLLRSAETRYHKPALAERELALVGRIADESGAWRPVVVHAEARDDRGDLVSECDFKEVPLSIDKFERISGLAPLPENWRTFLANVRRPRFPPG